MYFYFVCIITWKWWEQKLSNHNKRMSISCICHVFLLSLHNNMEMVKTEADPASNMWAMSAVTLVLTPLPHSFSLPNMKYKATIHSLQLWVKINAIYWAEHNGNINQNCYHLCFTCYASLDILNQSISANKTEAGILKAEQKKQQHITS